MPTSSNRKFRGVSRPHGRLPPIWLVSALIPWVLFGTVRAEENLPQVLAEWPIEENGLPPVVRVDVNGRSLVLEIDTGASNLTVLARHRFALTGKGRSCRVQLSDRQIERTLYRLESLSAGKWSYSGAEAGIPINEDIAIHLDSHRLDGILPSGVLRKVCLQIDYDQKRCRLLSEYTPDDEDVPFRLTMTGGVPWIHSRIGEYGDLIVDTGDSLGFMWPGNLSSELVEDRDFVRWRNGVVDKPDGSRERILLRSLTIGDSDLKLENVQGRPAEIATMGLQVLSRFRMTIDYPNAMLYLAPRKTPHKVLAPDASGIALLNDQRGYYVWFVYEGTPASEAGLKRDDRILTVQGKPATDFTFYELEGLFTQGGKTVTLGLERGGARFERRLALRFPIEYPPKWPERKSVVRTIPSD